MKNCVRIVAAMGVSLWAQTLFAGEESFSGEWIVRRESTRLSWEELSDRAAPTLHFVRSFGPGDSFGLFRAEDPARQSVQRIEGAAYVQPNFRYMLLDGLDPDFEKSWGLQNDGQSIGELPAGLVGKDIGATKAWEIHTGLGEVVVAVIDSGMDLNHEDLVENLWVNSREVPGNGIDDEGNGFVDDRNGWNSAEMSAKVQDENGHGSHCAGIIGAAARNGKGSRGINWKVQLMPIKFLDSDGVGSTEAAIRAIDYAVKNGAAIINASWGSTKFDQALFDTVKWAGDSGVLFVAAAGNSGNNNDDSSYPMYPAAFRLPGIISVAAYNNRDELAIFSNFGKETVHIGAPGVAIFSTTLGGYKVGDGTSYAAPFVSGAAALLKSWQPSLGVLEIKERLLQTSEVIGYYEKERTQTGGRVHVYNALKDIRPPRPRPPEMWDEYPTALATDHPYAESFSKKYEVVHSGATHLKVHFARLGMESCCDSITIKDREGRFVTRYSGQKNDFWSADVLGDTLVIEFVSDYSITDFGFDIDRYGVSFELTPWSAGLSPGLPLRALPLGLWGEFLFANSIP